MEVVVANVEIVCTQVTFKFDQRHDGVHLADKAENIVRLAIGKT